MRSNATLLAPCLIGLATLAFPPSPKLHASAASTPLNQAGKALGLWQLPAPAHPGHVVGMLADASGQPKFQLNGLLSLEPSPAQPGQHGNFFGQLELAAPPGASQAPIAWALGHWVAGPLGHGKFEIVLLQPGTAMSQLHPIGLIKGAFLDHDGAGSANPPGHFHGLWKISG